MENPGALTGATGANRLTAKVCQKPTLKRPIAASGNGLGGDWNKARWGWKRAVKRDSRLSKAAKLIAVTLVDDFANHASGRCNPFIATLCEAVGDPERSVQRALADLEVCGWIVRSKGHGRGKASSITFVADTALGAHIPENVFEIAAHRTENRAQDAAKKVPSVTPVRSSESAERLPEMIQKGATGGGSHIEPRYNQNTGVPTGAGPRATGQPSKPILNLASVAHHGSYREAEWNAYLAARGWPRVGDLGIPSSDAGGIGWEVPFRRPPSRHNTIESLIVQKWVEWAISQMEARRAAG